MKITMQDMHKRLSYLSESDTSVVGSPRINSMTEAALHNGNVNNIIFCIENCFKLSGTSEYRVAQAINLFEALTELGTEGQIRKEGNFIIEAVIPKTRDAKQTQLLIKRRLGATKTKISTKINNNINDGKNIVANSIENMKSNLNKNTAGVKGRVQNAISKAGIKSDSKDAAVKEMYEKMDEAVMKCRHCDRVLENYNKISGRFNLDKLICENTIHNGIEDTINELCRLIDTYNMPDNIKLNSVLESAWYGLKKNGIIFEGKSIINPAVDYFLMKEGGKDTCKSILSATMLYDKDDDMKDVKFITEEDPEEPKKLDEFAMLLHEADKEALDAEEFDKLFNDFKAKEEDHKENKIKEFINKLYTKKPSQIIDNVPKILSWVRMTFVLGTVAINPILGAVVALADQFVRLHLQRDETEKMLKALNAEKQKSQTKYENAKSDEDRDRLNKYMDSLDDAIYKINEYYESMLTDAEIDKQYDDQSASEDSFKGIADDITGKTKDGEDDFDFGDFDFDELDESAIYLPMLAGEYEKYTSHTESMMDLVKNNITKLPYTILESLAMVASNCPQELNPHTLKSLIEMENDAARHGHTKFNSDSSKYIRMNEYYETMIRIQPKVYTEGKTIQEAYKYISAVNTIYECLTDINKAYNEYSPILEFSFSNSLKLASEKLKKTIQTLSDKDKTISKNIDVSMNSFKKAVESSLTNDNREAIIKGSILPSASKMLKMALGSAALAIFVNPIAAVIAVLGYIGCSAKYKSKERQLVVDEIEIELKMTQKYIDIAESNNDMTALKQLLKIQRDLERQRQRIKYKMQVDFGQKVHNTEDTSTDGID